LRIRVFIVGNEESTKLSCETSQSRLNVYITVLPQLQRLELLRYYSSIYTDGLSETTKDLRPIVDQDSNLVPPK
jgi:hypothetical protein